MKKKMKRGSKKLLWERLTEYGWKEDSPDHFHLRNMWGYDTVDLTLGDKKVEFYGRCYPSKEGWEMSTRTYTEMCNMLP